MRKMKSLLLVTGFLASSNVSAALEQIVSLSPSMLVDSALTDSAGSGLVSLTGTYASSDGAKTTGVGVSIYFDSAKLVFDSLNPPKSSALAEYLLASTETPDLIQDDMDDEDGDANTDKKAIIAFASFNGGLPPSGDAFTISFGAAGSDPAGRTQVNVVVMPAAGYRGSAEPVVINFDEWSQ